MPVKVYRIRSGRVHSYSKLAYAIEHDSITPAHVALDGKKRRYLFSEVGVGVYPILIRGSSRSEILTWLSQQHGLRFTIKGTKLDHNEDDLDYFLERELERRTGHKAHREKRTMEDFTIHIKWRGVSIAKSPIEIHDAGMEAFKNVALFTGGMVGAGISGAVSAGTSAAPSKLSQIVSAVKDLVGAAPDVYDIGKTVAGGHGKKGGGGDAGLVVSYVPLSGGLDTEYHSIAAIKLGQIAAAI